MSFHSIPRLPAPSGLFSCYLQRPTVCQALSQVLRMYQHTNNFFLHHGAHFLLRENK